MVVWWRVHVPSINNVELMRVVGGVLMRGVSDTNGVLVAVLFASESVDALIILYSLVSSTGNAGAEQDARQ
jgi:hypothetical protein